MSVDNSSLLICFGIITYCIFSFFQGKNGTAKNAMVIDDNFTIGYIEKTKKVTPAIKLAPVKIKITEVEDKKPKTLQEECVRIMIAIGYSQSSAKQIVKDFFKKHTADSLEDFFVKINNPEFNSAN